MNPNYKYQDNIHKNVVIKKPVLYNHLNYYKSKVRRICGKIFAK